MIADEVVCVLGDFVLNESSPWWFAIVWKLKDMKHIRRFFLLDNVPAYIWETAYSWPQDFMVCLLEVSGELCRVMIEHTDLETFSCQNRIGLR